MFEGHLSDSSINLIQADNEYQSKQASVLPFSMHVKSFNINSKLRVSISRFDMMDYLYKSTHSHISSPPTRAVSQQYALALCYRTIERAQGVDPKSQIRTSPSSPPLNTFSSHTPTHVTAPPCPSNVCSHFPLSTS